MLKKSGPHPRVAKLNHNKHALLFQLSTSEKRIHWFVSEFTSLDGASRTRTFQAADSITFIQVFNSQFSDQTLSGSDTHFGENKTLEYLDNAKDFAFNLNSLIQSPRATTSTQNGFRLDYPPLLVERPKQRAQNPSQRRQNLICEQHRVMIETKRGTSGRAAEAASGGCDDGEERAEQRRDLQFGQLVQFALSNFIPTNHIVHHLPNTTIQSTLSTT
ncbi:hypothetical protein BLNAU_4842 [Blattamonas nauphoetae]|uniref:Uncharacterized protein n=1 Tax=Blattamonas nauphoetae TaxID=2049346 RepID=A0ABQ9Y9G1_9EUKA|nr:hypothetical protein BLNAU_4842 [Blattamonas nauphoetae]